MIYWYEVILVFNINRLKCILNFKIGLVIFIGILGILLFFRKGSDIN